MNGSDTIVGNVRLRGALVDIVIRDGRIADVVGDGQADRTGVTTVLDGQGGVVIPPLVDSHAHLDKTLWGLPWRPNTAAPGLHALIANEHAGRRELPPVADRAAALLATYIDYGVLHIRTHVDVDPEVGLSSVHGIRESADRFAGVVDVEIVAFPQSGMLVNPPTLDLLEQAVGEGVGVVGGLDPSAYDRDARGALDALFDLADRHGCGLDIHLHSRGELGAFEVDEVIARTRSLGLHGRVNLSHAFCLSTVGELRAGQLIEQLGELQISVTTVAPGGVAPLPLRLMSDSGVNVGLGQDGIRDLWSPFGTGDLLERCTMLAWLNGFRKDEDLQLALGTATTNGAAIMGLTDYGIDVGRPASFLVVAAETEAEAVVAHPPRTLVLRDGRSIKP